MLTGTIQLFNILETKPDIMGFSCLLGITRVANVFTILAFVTECMKCDISDIMSMIVHIVQLAILVLDIVLTGAKIIISIGVNMIITGLSIVIETAMQFLPCMKINVWIIILLVCIVMTSIILDCWIQCCIIGAILSGVSKINPRELRYITISGSTNVSVVSVPVNRRL